MALKAVAQGGVNVGVAVELAEEGVGVVAEEDVAAGFDNEVVGDFVGGVGAEVAIAVGGRIIGEEADLEILVE